MALIEDKATQQLFDRVAKLEDIVYNSNVAKNDLSAIQRNVNLTAIATMIVVVLSMLNLVITYFNTW